MSNAILYGAARTLDLYGQFDEYDVSPTPREADGRAIISDMMAVALDINSAVAAFAYSDVDAGTSGGVR